MARIKRDPFTLISQDERNTIAHDVRHDFDYDQHKDASKDLRDRTRRVDSEKGIPISEYSAFVIDPKAYHPSTPYIATSTPTSVISFKYQTTMTASLDSGGSYSCAVQVGQASDSSGAVLYGGLLPNKNTGTGNYENMQITDLNSGINVDKNIFSSVAPVYPANSSYTSFSDTVEKHFSGSRLIAARLSVTPLSSNFIKDGLMYGCSCPKGGTRELGPNNTDPTEADYVNMPKIFSCPGMKTVPCSDGKTINVMWYPKDSDSFEFVPSRTTFSSGEWNRKFRSGAMIVLCTAMTSEQSFLVDYELFFQSTPSNATFNITGSSLSLGNPVKQSDAMNLFLTNSTVHVTEPDMHLHQNFESNEVGVERGKSVLFVSHDKPSTNNSNKIKLNNKDFIEVDSTTEKPKQTVKMVRPIYGKAVASAVTKPGGGSSKTAIGRKVKEIAKLTDPVVDVIESFLDIFS